MAGVTIKLGVNSKLRSPNRWKETTTYTELWIIETDLDSYAVDLEAALSPLWTYTLSERSRGAEVALHYSVTLENTTAASPPAGAWVQAKQHFDGVIGTGEWSDIDKVRTTVLSTVTLVRKLAKY